MGRFRDVELSELELTGPRLLLRPWRAADAATVHTAMQDPSVYRFVPIPQPYGLRDAEAFVAGPGNEGRPDGTGLGSAVIERATGQLVGSAALRLGAEPEIGFWVAADARGRGFAAEATRVLSDWAFGLGVPRVRLLCDVRNLASARTALAAGFTYEGVARQQLQGGGSAEVPVRHGDNACFSRLATDGADPVPPSFPPLPGGPARGELTDGVLALRVMTPADGPAFAETEDAQTLRWSPYATARSAAEVQLVADRAGLGWLVGEQARTSILDAVTGRFAGSVQLRRVGPPGVLKLGYVVHPDWRRRGYATRALRLITDWAFEHAGAHRLELGAAAGNLASHRAALSAGFAREALLTGRLRSSDGSFEDEVLFSLLR